MSEHLETVNENIKICEDIQRIDPGYYDEHWANVHTILLTIKEDLENKEEQK